MCGGGWGRAGVSPFLWSLQTCEGRRHGEATGKKANPGHGWGEGEGRRQLECLRRACQQKGLSPN